MLWIYTINASQDHSRTVHHGVWENTMVNTCTCRVFTVTGRGFTGTGKVFAFSIHGLTIVIPTNRWAKIAISFKSTPHVPIWTAIVGHQSVLCLSDHPSIVPLHRRSLIIGLKSHIIRQTYICQSIFVNSTSLYGPQPLDINSAPL